MKETGLNRMTMSFLSKPMEFFPRCSIVDLCAVCENDSLRTIKKALSELTDKGYLLRIGNTYAVNKVRITQMKLA